MFEVARGKVAQLLDEGVEPIFIGSGRAVFDGFYSCDKRSCYAFLTIPDECCRLSDDELARYAKESASNWIEKVGCEVIIKQRTHKVTVASLSDLIIRAVKKGRREFNKDKIDWELKWKKAKAKRAQELAQEAMWREGVDKCVAEALRYIVHGGRLTNPWATRGKQATPAETWHLRSPNEFNQRAKPPQTHKTEETDKNGGIVRTRIEYENSDGGEMTAAGEQAEYMIACFAKYAGNGDQNALQWLYHLSLKAVESFWMAVEQQPELSKRVSEQWRHAPVSINSSELSVKVAKTMLRQLNLQKPLEHDLRIDPESAHHRDIVRIEKAIRFLLQTPPVSTPWTGVDEYAPNWIREAWPVMTNPKPNPQKVAETYWHVYEAAMTHGQDAPWRVNSRPRKAKEKFVKAVIARLPKSGRTRTP